MKERKRNRLRGFDYSSDNLYFITMCVQDRVCCFGEIRHMRKDGNVNDDMDGNFDGGGRDRSRPVPTSTFVPTSSSAPSSSVPNADFHQVMVLNEHGRMAVQQWDWLEEQYPYVVLHTFVVMPNHVHGIIEIKGDSSSLKIKSLSELIGAYKTTVSKKIHLSGYSGFAWQRSFYEHIIRNERSYEAISEYIEKNPLNWNQDKFYNS